MIFTCFKMNLCQLRKRQMFQVVQDLLFGKAWDVLVATYFVSIIFCDRHFWPYVPEQLLRQFIVFGT